MTCTYNFSPIVNIVYIMCLTMPPIPSPASSACACKATIIIFPTEEMSHVPTTWWAWHLPSPLSLSCVCKPKLRVLEEATLLSYRSQHNSTAHCRRATPTAANCNSRFINWRSHPSRTVCLHTYRVIGSYCCCCSYWSLPIFLFLINSLRHGGTL